MDPVLLQILLGIGSLVGGYFLRHLTGPAVAPAAPSSHPVIDALSSAALSALLAAVQKQQAAQGHGELTDLLAHLAPPPVQDPAK